MIGREYWLNDLLTTTKISLVLAHAKNVKAIAYAKVKTDKVYSHILAQLLLMDYIPEAHKISREKHILRDALRARLKIVQRHTGITNSLQLLLAKYNYSSPEELQDIARYQYGQLEAVEAILKEQMLDLEKQLYPSLIPNEDFQGLLCIPGICKINAFNIALEVYDINRFVGEKNFFSYCSLVTSARTSAGKSIQRTSKDENKYLKAVFMDAVTPTVQYYPVIRKWHSSKLRKKNKFVAKNILTKVIARIVFYVLKDKFTFNNKFKGKNLEHT